MKKKIKYQIKQSIKVKESLIDMCTDDIEKAVIVIIKTLNNGGKILWCGNGGSAADAQHLSTELMGGMTDHHRK